MIFVIFLFNGSFFVIFKATFKEKFAIISKPLTFVFQNVTSHNVCELLARGSVAKTFLKMAVAKVKELYYIRATIEAEATLVEQRQKANVMVRNNTGSRPSVFSVLSISSQWVCVSQQTTKPTDQSLICSSFQVI